MRGLSWGLIVLTLSSCSATQFIYNRVDILVRWYLDDYVSLDREQQARFDGRLEGLLDWHRREELPAYVVLLDDALTILDEGVPLEDARAMTDRIEDAAIRFQDPFLELLLSVGEDLRSDQRQEFVDALLSKQEEFEEDRMPLTDALARLESPEMYAARLGRTADEFLDDYSVGSRVWGSSVGGAADSANTK